MLRFLALALVALCFASSAHASSSHRRADVMLAAGERANSKVGAAAGAGAEGLFDTITGIATAAASLIKKASIAAKMQVLVDAIQAASPDKIAKVSDEAVRKALQDRLVQTAAGMVKQTEKEQNKLPTKGVDKTYAGAEKTIAKAAPAAPALVEMASASAALADADAVLLELELELELGAAAGNEDNDPLKAEAKRIVSDAKVKAAIADLAASLVDENADKIKIPKDKSVENLTDKVTTAIVTLLQRADETGKKASGTSAGTSAAAGAAAGAAAAASASAPTPTSAPASTSGSSRSPRFASSRFRRVLGTSKAPATVTIELSAKSYIRPVNSKGCWVICPDVLGYVIDPVCSGAAIAFCASMSTVGVLSDSEAYGSGGNFRLYSKIKFELTCDNGKVTSVRAGDKEGKVGKEGPLDGQPPNGDYDRVIAKVVNGEGHIGYMFSGRPHRAAEPGFQLLKFRTCTWIWHFPYFKINKCNNDGSWSADYQFGGSNFPTRRLWYNGKEADTIQQGRIDALWDASSRDRALVDGWFPYDQ